MLGNLGTHLGGVAVDGLAAGDNEVEVHRAQGAGDGVGGGEGIGAAELAVGEQDGAVHTHGEGLAEDGLGLGQAHGDDGHLGIVFIFELQSKLQTPLVVGVHDAGQACAVERAGHGVDLGLGRVGHLLYTNNDFHFFLGFLRSCA